ncbi:uncharacterized protein LOC113356574 [Papaver somniferum]|uniref:uncharacterized protein LOC113356574 n=1 Tax=Papaver somniferum TaxID=3469 RepID=UPI000E7053E5|nr:uncharacterized protein LOC113356574 [Papaver somniferum]
MERLVDVGVDITQLPIPTGGEDNIVWMPDFKGEFNVSSTKDLFRQIYPMLEGASLIWKKEVHPVLAAQNWKFLRRACATYDLIKERFKIQTGNKCCLCGSDEETLDHVLFNYSFAARAWNWIAGIFSLQPNVNLLVSFKAAKGRSQMVRDLWLIANLVIKPELWVLWNRGVFDHMKPNWNVFFK